jgi:formate dehydrogenase subunit gamma
MIRNPRDLQRYTPEERVNHWVTGISFILLALSGLAFFHPAFYPLTALFGGGEWARLAHPFLGLILFAAFAQLFLRFRHLNKMTQVDHEWLSRVKEMMDGDDHNMPHAGKYNGGQKRMFWVMAICVALLFVSGILIWRSHFDIPTSLARFGAVVHAATAAVMIAMIIVHVYAAIWVKGTVRAMWYGTVTRAWAKQHHRAWYREMTGKD